MRNQTVFRDRYALRGWTTRILKEHDTTMRFRMVNLYDRGTRWLMIGVQHNDLLTGRKFHIVKIPFFPAAKGTTYEQPVHKRAHILVYLEMKRLSPLIIVCLVLGCQPQSEKKLPRIAIAGLGIESSTFSPALTEEPAFHAKYDTDVFSTYPFMAADSPLRREAVWIPTIVGHSLPGGAVTRAAYESLVNKTLDSLKKYLPYDGLYFDIHGAMSVVGLDDPEGDFIKRIRQVVGKNTIISTSMDLHGNVSMALAENTDLITDYRLAPHEDAMETKERAVKDLLNRLDSGKGKPAYKAWVPIPVLLPGEKTSTRIEPAKSVFGAIAPTLAQPGIIDGGIWVGYPWADEPRNHAVVVVTGDDKQAVTAAAEKLARSFWAARNGYAFVATTKPWKETLDSALASSKHPFFISDMGDNPTAGGAGDVTWTLNQLLADPRFKSANGPSLIYASIPGPDLIQQALKAGVGGKVDGYAGANVDNRYSPPAHLAGTVESIVKGDKDAEVESVIRVGSLHVIVTQKRKPYHKEIDFTRLGLNPRKTDIVIVKIGYLEPELYNMRADWIMALTPGGVDQDIEHLTYKRIQRPMFPFDKTMPDPDLSAQLVPSSDSLP
jgi:microcystin degradation protein MlrC